jgi:ribokinase
MAVDTTGAGDVFCGVFAAGIARQRAVTEAARWAVRAAALSVTRRGTQRAIPTREEMRSLC